MSVEHPQQQKSFEISLLGIFCMTLLILSVMGSALGVIISAFENRRYLAEIESLRADARNMQVLWGQYLVEKNTWAAYGRVHDMAEKDLGMQAPQTDKIIVVKVQ
ncbi:MAG TPA: cell division protein FtsL [Pseudomonadales bacterium]|jgi:cell division protein FtsL|nr:cell division protein FtsL [Pseudomonadales bacterium]HNI37624.1 cell division protein FtsL [Pseudomonadales bacterium]HNL92401.1 cell division protein FtsL [Pseudomonadales bacterium]HNN87265.1 cell division protein FtsL [Pseudomonadales bacterium]